MNLAIKGTIIVILIYILINLFWGFFVKEIYYKGGDNLTSFSIKESISNGCFVEKLSFEPNTIEINSKKFLIKDAWLEKKYKTSFVLSLLPGIFQHPIYNNKDGYQFSFIMQEKIPNDWFFVVGEEKRAVSRHGTQFDYYVYSTYINTKKWNSINIILTNNWQFENSIDHLYIKKNNCTNN